jgi:hypothetical protein
MCGMTAVHFLDFGIKVNAKREGDAQDLRLAALLPCLHNHHVTAFHCFLASGVAYSNIMSASARAGQP